MGQGRGNTGSPGGEFEALNMALEGQRPSGPHASQPPEAARPSAEPSESLGRSNAAYASAGPQPIPSTRPPRELDQDVPAVIVAPDEFPSSSRQKTARMVAPLLQRPQTPTVTIPRSSVPAPSPFAYPSSPPPYASPAMSAMGATGGGAGDTGRRPRQNTIVVHTRGPSGLAKLGTFIVALLLVVGAGFIAIVLKKPELLGLTRLTRPAPVEAAPVRVIPVAVPSEPAPVVTPAPNVLPASAPEPAAPAASASAPKRVARPAPPRQPVVP